MASGALYAISKATNASTAFGRMACKRLAYFYQGTLILAQRTPEEGSPPSRIPCRLSHQRQPQVHHRLQHQLQLHHQPHLQLLHLLHRPKISPLLTHPLLHQGYPVVLRSLNIFAGHALDGPGKPNDLYITRRDEKRGDPSFVSLRDPLEDPEAAQRSPRAIFQ
ncbi:hypothetical protein LAZ67_14001969 [Cordylochernes scorpioides]|uniref:Uncharacterized protein n=1 Tax=Cordylochernes scorpioides TaxID=51811 RepID=A0ABY6LAI3_9ARAC|nr:hypothetical protein LAZ67_14001969 [Cordylochernes scorpioides]